VLLEGVAKDYTFAVASDPAVGPDGRLATPIRSTNVVPIGPDPPSTCTTTLGGPYLTDARPHRQPGTYYWQVWRRCGDCTTRFEVGPVWRFTVSLGTKLALKAPRVAYAGYPTKIVVTITDSPGGDLVVIQRKVGPAWRTIATADRFGDIAAAQEAAIVQLPVGKVTLRAALERADGAIAASPQTLVEVRPVRRPVSFALGRYRDAEHQSLRLSMTRRGEIRGFRTFVTLTCPVVDGIPNIQPGLIEFPPLRIAPDGRFVKRIDPEAGLLAWIEGRVQGNVAVGYTSLRRGECGGDLRFTARR
jgi:hypothetical protein